MYTSQRERVRTCTRMSPEPVRACVSACTYTREGDRLQFIVWPPICQVSGRGRYRRFRRIFGVENCQLSQWNSIRIVHQHRHAPAHACVCPGRSPSKGSVGVRRSCNCQPTWTFFHRPAPTLRIDFCPESPIDVLTLSIHGPRPNPRLDPGVQA